MAIPSRVSSLILHAQAKPVNGAYYRTPLLPPTFRDGSHPYRQLQPGQSRVYQVSQLRTDIVYRRESTSTTPVVLKVVRVTGAAYPGNTMDQLRCAPLFDYHLRTLFSTKFHVGFLKKNPNAPRPSEHPPVRGEKMSKRLGGIKGCK